MKKIILSSLVILGLVGAIAGATIAYFSSTKTSVGNTFAAGTMEFRIARPGDTGHQIFSISDLKPGQVVSGYFVVVNDSTAGLDMKWKAWVPSFSGGELDDVLKVKVTMNPTGYVPTLNPKYTIAGPPNHQITDWTDIHNLGTGNTILTWNYECSAPGVEPQPFRVDWAGVYMIEVKMLETAGNYYQGKTFTGDINFYATQCEATL